MDGQWVEEEKLEAHSDWVRDVAWAPNVGLPVSTIASCSQVDFSLVGQLWTALFYFLQRQTLENTDQKSVISLPFSPKQSGRPVVIIIT